MEGRATAKVSEYMKDFKECMKEFVLDQDCSHEVKSAIMQQIYNYEGLEFTKEDFIKRKRMKNIVPRCDRCCAKRANNDQCTRKRRDGSLFCGTHVKGTPHGTIDNVSNGESAALKQVELVAQEIKRDRREDLFAATPPLEAKKMLFSLVVTEGIGYQAGCKERGMKL